jgi:peptidoglycan hydrolase-like protein with peptidoglycan-binding domain
MTRPPEPGDPGEPDVHHPGEVDVHGHGASAHSAAPLASGRPRRRRLRGAGAAVLLLALAGTGTSALVAARSPDASGAAAAKPVTTADVTRTNLVDTEQVDGSLGYDDQQTLGAGARGVLTGLPAEGATVGRGRTLYRVDNRPVTLLYGKLPLYRTLEAGIDDGPDVTQLEQNLRALGYGDDLTVDGHFSSATTDAVRAWQSDRGLDDTGKVDATQVLFRPGAARIGEHKAAVGANLNPGAAVASISSTTRVVTVDLAADKASIAATGDEVDVELPDGSAVKGTIVEVGKVAKTPSQDSSTQDGATGDPTITVTVRVDDPRATGDLDQTPVKVDLAAERKRGVLAVPVTALVALAEGGYAVEVSDGATSHLTRVTTGLFAGGRVEVTGAGLRAGQKVVVPA